MSETAKERLRQLPAVGRLLNTPVVRQWLEEHPDSLVGEAVRLALEDCRQQIISDDGSAPTVDAVLELAQRHLQLLGRPSLRRVINATGIVLHTGLGRAPLSEDALNAVREVASGYCNLEVDLDSGQRGRRTDHVRAILCRLTGAEAAAVVNNNAAATLLILKMLTQHYKPGAKRYRKRNVIVSRGQLVEIGGSYRLPEIMQASGVELNEVGTTNRTRIADYEAAINPRTAAILRVHTSNYRVAGFAEQVPIEQLVALGQKYDLPVVDDLGSGAMVAIEDEPQVQASIAAGADLVCFSGDKLLGGPQVGIILGSEQYVRAIEKSPLMRTYRLDKMTLAALEATLRTYFDESAAREQIPALAMLAANPDNIRQRARRLEGFLRGRLPDIAIEVADDVCYAGGGSLPTAQLPTVVLRLKTATDVEHVARRLRAHHPPIIARIHKGALVLDCRTMAEADLDTVATALARVIG